MDPTVPVGAARLLDFIRDTEVGTEARSGYDVIFGFNQNRLPKPVTSMTIDEVLGSQASWSKRFGSSATGGYQFMRATLAGLKTELRLLGRQILDPNLQDRLGFHLLKRRGYERFVSGQIDRTEFGRRLAQEWASFPVLVATKGAHRQLSRGQSYYAGDGLNKALVPPERVEAILNEVLELAKASAAAPVAKPEPDETAEPTTTPEQTMTEKPLTPVEQTNKANMGALATAAASGGPGIGLIYLWSLLPSFPQEWANDPQALIIIAGLSTTAFATAGAWIGAYRARDKRFQPEA